MKNEMRSRNIFLNWTWNEVYGLCGWLKPNWLMMIKIFLFFLFVWSMKGLIFSGDHCQTFSPLQISDSPRATWLMMITTFVMKELNCINPFQASVSFFTPFEMSKNFWSSNAVRGYRMVRNWAEMSYSMLAVPVLH